MTSGFDASHDAQANGKRRWASHLMARSKTQPKRVGLASDGQKQGTAQASGPQHIGGTFRCNASPPCISSIRLIKDISDRFDAQTRDDRNWTKKFWVGSNRCSGKTYKYRSLGLRALSTPTFFSPPSHLILTSHMSSSGTLFEQLKVAQSQVAAIADLPVRHLWIAHPPPKKKILIKPRTKDDNQFVFDFLNATKAAVGDGGMGCFIVLSNTRGSFFFSRLSRSGNCIQLPCVTDREWCHGRWCASVRPRKTATCIDVSLGHGTMWSEHAPHTSSRHRDPDSHLQWSYTNWHDDGERCSCRE